MSNNDICKSKRIRKLREFPDVSEERRRIMSSVKHKHTTPEKTVRSILHKLGFRFTVNGKLNSSLPGKPDIVLPKWKTVVLVHGCFWHGHEKCNKNKRVKTRTEFWESKINLNKERDKKVIHDLNANGWKVLVIWECEVNSKKRAEQCFYRLKNIILNELSLE